MAAFSFPSRRPRRGYEATSASLRLSSIWEYGTAGTMLPRLSFVDDRILSDPRVRLADEPTDLEQYWRNYTNIESASHNLLQGLMPTLARYGRVTPSCRKITPRRTRDVARSLPEEVCPPVPERSRKLRQFRKLIGGIGVICG